MNLARKIYRKTDRTKNNLDLSQEKVAMETNGAAVIFFIFLFIYLFFIFWQNVGCAYLRFLPSRVWTSSPDCLEGPPGRAHVDRLCTVFPSIYF